MKTNFFIGRKNPPMKFLCVSQNGLSYAIEYNDILAKLSADTLINVIKESYSTRTAKCILGADEQVKKLLACIAK